VLRGRVARCSGFTLIELVVAIAIFSILAALAVPAMRTWVANAKVRAVADALQNGIRLAQVESLRRSRQVVFSLTNSTAPATSLTAAANGAYWALNFVPAMTDGSETVTFIQSGSLAANTANVSVTGPAEICFNSVGRLVGNTSTGVAGGSCTLPTTGTPPTQNYVVSLTNADRKLQVEVGLGGQVHLCDLTQGTLSSTNPYGC
jgi:type IV fimbrial biogenesis protein FimT